MVCWPDDRLPMISLRYASLLLPFAILPSAGCSFVAVQGPPSAHRMLDEFDCTTGNGIPVVDGLVAIGIPAGAALAFGDDGMSGAGVAAAVGAGLPFAASAIYGLITTGNCRDARAELYARRAEAARVRP
jgi:hypothetical protein